MMVDESLIAYLGDSELIRSIFNNNFTFDESKVDEYNKIADKLKSVKVLDPACGSGAFPMGLLNRMIDILERISPDESIYDLKLFIIENCLYGSDIQSIAAQITKLRFFISLICDCEKDVSKPNFGIPTLPNLETKFVSANSLIAKKERAAQGILFENPDIEITKNELHEIRHQHFSAKSASTKHRLREKDQALREKLAKLLSDDNNFAPEDAKQLAAWNPYDQNAVSPFFDPKWMFGVEDGFDIVIGNPPYIQLQNNGGELAKLYERCGYSTFARTGDIYCLFYERGWQLLKNNGHLCYITSNKWMRAGYGEKTREFFATKTNPALLIDFAGVKIFESATVDTNILLFAKASNQHKTVCAVTNKQNKDSIKNLSDFVQQQNTICDFSTPDSWVILSPIEQSIKRKIEAVGTPLKDWDINIYRGVLTGCNEAFIINSEKRDEILANCQTDDERNRTAELIRPILRGRDIKRYIYDWADVWLINTHNGIKGRLERIHIEDYPAVKAHLDQFWDKIKDRADQGDTPYNLRNCAYLEDFYKPKLVWAELSRTGNSFAIDTSKILLGNTGYILTVPSNNIKELGYIMAFMNSRIVLYQLDRLTTRFDDNGWRWLRQFVEEIKIPKFSDNPQISGIALEASKSNQEDISEQLNNIISSILGLNEQELSYINDSLKGY